MINKNSIKDNQLSPTLEVHDITLDCDNSLVLYYNIKGGGIKPDTSQHSFFWLIETWLKNNDIPYKVNRGIQPYASNEGCRVFGKELNETEWFIQNIE